VNLMAHRRWPALGILAAVLAACGSGTSGTSLPSSAPTPAVTVPATAATSPTAAGRVLHYVEFGDSWPEGAHCGGCRTFAGLWADSLEQTLSAKIDVTDFMGSREPSLGESKGSTTLRQAIEGNAAVRSAVTSADIILIATGPNEGESIFPALQAGTCGGSDGADCIRMLGATWKSNFDAILSEVDALRVGKPTVVRLVDAANPFVSVPAMTEGMPPGFATGNGALIFRLLNDAMCAAATAHHALCVDVRPILNGSSMTNPVDEDSGSSMQAVADALVATGTSELR
jgi:hypothetical protein